MSKTKRDEAAWDEFYDNLKHDKDGAKVYDFTSRYPSQSSKSGGSKAATTYVKCANTHPPLKIGDYVIYGGACADPVVKDADVYVAFERYGTFQNKKSYPWAGGYSFSFPITDGYPPDDVEETGKLLGFLKTMLEAGKKVHIGCIGGHGRTGTILAALVCIMTGNKNAIEYVRTNYCKKAVESQKQIDWLHKHFGITKVEPSKAHTDYYTGRQATMFGSSGVSKNYSALASKGSTQSSASLFETVKPVRVKGNIWGF